MLAAVASSVASAQPRHQAVLVGINNYQGTGFTSLNFAVSDMRKLEEKLDLRGFEVALLTNADATKSAIERAVADANAKRGDGDLLLLAMTGHGVQTRFAGDDTANAFFCPAKSQKTDPATMIRLPALIEKLGNKGPNLVLIDACRDDPKKGFSGNEFTGHLPGKTSVVLSCAAGQSAWETNRMYEKEPGFDPRKTVGHGVFMYHVLKALDGTGSVTWQQLLERVGQCNDTAKT